MIIKSLYLRMGGHLGQACIIALGWGNHEPAGMHGAILTV